jgi:hypothetical protein
VWLGSIVNWRGRRLTYGADKDTECDSEYREKSEQKVEECFGEVAIHSSYTTSISSSILVC